MLKKEYCRKHRINKKTYEKRKQLLLKSIKQGTFKTVKGQFKKELNELYNTHLLSTYGVL